MLIRFNVKNFLSFYETKDGKSVEFSMISGKTTKKSDHLYDDGKVKLLKLATVYGANAAGKSNLVHALNFMQETVTRHLPNGHTVKYCKVKDDAKDKPSYFEIEVKLDNKYYTYGFEVLLSKSQFVSEWLVELLPSGSEKIIFERDIQNGEISFGATVKTSRAIDKLHVYADDIREYDSILFLQEMNRNKNNIYQDAPEISAFQSVYQWINEKLDINYPDSPISDYSYFRKSEKVDTICQYIACFGTGIKGYKMVEIHPEEAFKDIPEQFRKHVVRDLESKIVAISNEIKESENQQISGSLMMRSKQNFFVINVNKEGIIDCQTIRFKHESENNLFELSEESDGTIRVLDLLEVLISEENKTYVIDELDRCLHPSLTYKYIEEFLKIAKEKNIQLITTTHESRLLDFDLLRRDEIWFINKKSDGTSDIYSLEEYNERFDKKIDKAYLEGRYGGVPIFDTLFPME